MQSKRLRKKVPVRLSLINELVWEKLNRMKGNRLREMKVRDKIVRRLFGGKKYLLTTVDSHFRQKGSVCIKGAMRKYNTSTKSRAIKFALRDIAVVKSRLRTLSSQAAKLSFKDYPKYDELNHVAGSLSHRLNFVLEIIEKELLRAEEK